MLAPLLLASSLSPAPEPPSVETLPLRWSAPDGCPAQADVEASIGRLLSSNATPDGELEVEATVTLADGEWRMSMVTRHGAASEERSFTADNCKALAETAAVLVAIAIDPVGVSGSLAASQTEVAGDADDATDVITTETEQGAASETPPPPEFGDPTAIGGSPPAAQPTLTRDAEPSAEPERRRAYGMRPAGGASLGPLPSVGPGVGLTLFGQFAWMRVEAQGGYWFAQPAFYSDAADVGVNVDLWSAGLRACPTPKVSIVEFPLCVGAELGSMRGRGLGVTQSRDVSSLWAAVTAGPGVSVEIVEHLAVSVVVDGIVSLRRPAFHIGEREPVHRAGSLGVRPYAGIELRFP